MTPTETVFEQYQSLQRTGECNMLNKSGVQRVANDKGFAELVVFIDEADYYADLIQQYDDLAKKYSDE